MYGQRSSLGDFRPVRKCLSISGSLLLLLGMLAVQSALTLAQPSEESYEDLAMSDDYANVDNVEWHRVKVVDGVVEKDHPIVMYKEDFVSEDYDPSKNDSASASLENSANAHSKRNYKDIAERRQRLNRNETEKEQYLMLKPEKMLFDVMPPLPSDDDIVSDISAAVKESEAPSKQALSKHPKKYRRRLRRSTDGHDGGDGAHSVHKRNPYYMHSSGFAANALLFVPQQQTKGQHSRYQSHPVPGKLWNSLSLSPVETPISFENRFGDENNQDRVIWSNIQKATSRPRGTTRRPPPSLLHESRPEYADMSIFTTRRPIASGSTMNRRTPPPLLHDSRPENADTSFLTRAPMTTTPSATTTRPRPGNVAANEINRSPVSQCVWAIVNCCSNRNSDIRYECFERLGCHGAFWDLNPCADNIRDNVVNYVSEIYN